MTSLEDALAQLEKVAERIAEAYGVEILIIDLPAKTQLTVQDADRVIEKLESLKKEISEAAPEKIYIPVYPHWQQPRYPYWEQPTYPGITYTGNCAGWTITSNTTHG